MATNNPVPIPPHDRPHFRIERFLTAPRYVSPRTGRTERPLSGDRREQAVRLVSELSVAFIAARERVAARAVATRRKSPGVYVELHSQPGKAIPELTWVKKGLRLGAVRPSEEDTQVGTLFIPDKSRHFLEEKLRSYGEDVTTAGKVPNRDRFENLASIYPATVLSLWADSRALPSDEDAKLWWECWTWRDRVEELRGVSQELGFDRSDHSLRFPDLEIILVRGSISQMQDMITLTSSIERLRFASDSPVFFTTTVERQQLPWVEDLAGRIVAAPVDSPAVCLLDTGVAREHPLIEKSLAAADCQTVDPAWGVDDSHPTGHGTNMAGSILFSDLTYPLGDQENLPIEFVLESVKLIPPPGFLPTDAENYGSITQSAVSVAEINAPARARTFCMAVTNLDVSGEQPTSWSASLDQLCSGNTSEGGDPGEPKRLFCVSAGNIADHYGAEDYEDLTEFPIEDPAQAWNALTVGGFTNKTEIHPEDPYASWSAFADAGRLSPYSRVTTDWIHGRTPIKPEVVFEAGNRALSPAQNELLSGVASLSLLTTARDFLTEPLTTFWATSPATAQAAGMAASLNAHDRSWWPETIRALMVHSALWTNWMQEQMDQCAGKTERLVLLRQFGYGVPSLGRALASAENDLFMIAQAELAPFFREGSRKEGKDVLSAPKFNEMHLYSLPWPVHSLQELGAQGVELRVTLSYFVEPNLGNRASTVPPRYRSCGLRFHMKRLNETNAQFQARLNELARNDENMTLPPEEDPDWLFGAKSIAAGSVHCDIWKGAAASLALRDLIAIVPVAGWWKDRVGARRYDSKIRYSMVVSITTADRKTELYSEVQQRISAAVPIAVSVET
jgi:hypothetical protein